MQLQKVSIRTQAPYDVVIGPGLLSEAGTYARSLLKASKIAVITDSNVAPLYLETVEESLRASGFSVTDFVFEAGEKSKNFTTLAAILEDLAAKGLTRSDALVALGGGVTGDITGLAAGLFLRGVPFLQMPTTVLAAVDSSVGGKTAVDLAAGKNLAGLFHQPRGVLCDTATLSTLSPEIFSEGLAEAIKYGILCDENLFEAFRPEITPEGIAPLVARCVAIKADYVAKDTFDKGVRAFLNLGHTFGHAIEKLSGFAVSHGAAVAVGTVLIARAGERMGLTAPGTAQAVARLFADKRLPVETPYPPEALAEAALGDKKRSADAITLVMVERIGKTFLKTVPVEELARIARLAKEA